MVAGRSGPKLPHPELVHGVPIFIDQLIKTLKIEQSPDSQHAHLEPDHERNGADSDVGATAILHGRDLLEEGFTLEQVIRDYGDVCQAVTSLAAEAGEPILAEEFRTFNRLLDDAMAAAVTEYSESKKGAVPVETGLPATVGLALGTDDLDHLETALTQSQLALASTEVALTAAHLVAREAQIRSLHDSLTGLPNRELFDDRLAKAIALAHRHSWTLAVMFLDLDQFKSINDAHGHAAGDAVLKEVAERLLKRARDEDTVCRTGGDEFLYLLMNPGAKENVESIAGSVLRGIAQPLAVGEIEFVVKPSIGIAMYPNDGSSGDQLIKNADAAMYRAKKHPRGFVLFGESDMDSTEAA
jgi:diguanylate cyclase (GGDEF)-like protein